MPGRWRTLHDIRARRARVPVRAVAGIVAAMRVLGLVLCVLLAPAAAWAQEAGTTARLSWARGVGAEACATEEVVASEVQARLGRDPFGAAAPTHRIEGLVTRDGATWRALIVVRLADGTLVGERSLESAATSCASLDAASALAVALVID